MKRLVSICLALFVGIGFVAAFADRDTSDFQV